MPIDPLELARALIRCPSVTPADAGALDVLQTALEPLGFTCHRLPFSTPGTPDIDNLYARFGSGGENFCFAGHTDVVPVGDAKAWTVDPFAAEIRDDQLFGRGAADMKSAIACFAAAAAEFLENRGETFSGSISFLITGDEEGPSINGTTRVLDWLNERNEPIDACLVGEPTNPTRLGEMVKIGRRGSLNATLTVLGVQGHSAYPHLADNPIPRLLKVLDALTNAPLDEGSAHFDPSTLALTSIDVGNPTSNVTPAKAIARFNIRFNDAHSSASLKAWLDKTCGTHGGAFELETEVSGEAFLTPPGRLSELICTAAQDVLGAAPELSTSGGTSDARFIRHVCPVAEFGLVGETIHKVDEHVPLADLTSLTEIYRHVLDGFFPQS
ncbi:MAG: succinyl-diaminopimelate desuccinylase [Rhodospirillaceae bacterium]|nr:succinyl-diaminopimelate desuccinylase [Rhodospirillaceae bacterium]MBT5659754.1 succinyl-diaminopimelate desuccinylase [Rhodospirillaceae bacterium]MBT5751444.1 succinyl-diaminopimelate desuccinylase [Rhodospirillaceae bacterium]MBT7942018.1 succinyl-diaminopimelate desuccinylase [Alphaproteobacteria bacterium]